MRVRSRLLRLERSYTGGGRCPVCGCRDTDMRFLVLVDPERGEPPEPHWGQEDLCPRCGGLRPPIRWLEWPPDAGEPSPGPDSDEGP